MYYRKVLQLCCFTNLWGDRFQVESHDLKNNKNIFDLPDDYGKGFDIVCAAPPCNQFTLANTRNWQPCPQEYIDIAVKCFTICKSSGGSWFLENPIGRIIQFIPELINYRIGTWQGDITVKKYVIYGNFITLFNPGKGKRSLSHNVTNREAWQSDFIETIKMSI